MQSSWANRLLQLCLIRTTSFEFLGAGKNWIDRVDCAVKKKKNAILDKNRELLKWFFHRGRILLFEISNRSKHFFFVFFLFSDDATSVVGTTQGHSFVDHRTLHVYEWSTISCDPQRSLGRLDTPDKVSAAPWQRYIRVSSFDDTSHESFCSSQHSRWVSKQYQSSWIKKLKSHQHPCRFFLLSQCRNIQIYSSNHFHKFPLKKKRKQKTRYFVFVFVFFWVISFFSLFWLEIVGGSWTWRWDRWAGELLNFPIFPGVFWPSQVWPIYSSHTRNLYLSLSVPSSFISLELLLRIKWREQRERGTR